MLVPLISCMPNALENIMPSYKLSVQVTFTMHQNQNSWNHSGHKKIVYRHFLYHYKKFDQLLIFIVTIYKKGGK